MKWPDGSWHERMYNNRELVPEHPQRAAWLLRFAYWGARLSPNAAVKSFAKELPGPDAELLTPDRVQHRWYVNNVGREGTAWALYWGTGSTM